MKELVKTSGGFTFTDRKITHISGEYLSFLKHNHRFIQNSQISVTLNNTFYLVDLLVAAAVILDLFYKSMI